MKRCPTCQSIYTDEGLNFCRVDGTALVSDSSALDDTSSTIRLPISSRQIGSTESQTELFSSGPVSTSSLNSPSRRRASRRSINSLAVLPLTNASDDPNMEYFSDGITESIINALTRLPKLRVVPRSTVFRYKGQDVDPQAVGRALDVRAVLTGRVLHVGERLVVKAELIDVVNESQLWGEQYNRKPDDIFDVQDEISREISEKLRLQLSHEEKRKLTKRHTEDPEAYRLYLRGRFYWNKRTEENFKKGAEFFQQAIELDPNYALAYAGLADTYILLGFYGVSAPQDTMPRAKAAAVRALDLDNSLAEAHTSLAYVLAFNEWNWTAAEKEFKRAIKLNPNYATARHWYGIFLVLISRPEEGIASVKRAQELDPLSLIINTEVGWAYYLTRQYDKAIKQYRATIELEPGFSVAHFFLGEAYAQKGMRKEAIAELRKAVELSGGSPLMKGVLGHVYALSGERDKALAILHELEQLMTKRYVSPFIFALFYVGLGDKDQAFIWLERAYEHKSILLGWINVEPMLNSLHDDERFADLLRRMNLS
jgi:TolB-like protein/Tfp pilus assembly protein PilF